jgi:hypothetical protein
MRKTVNWFKGNKDSIVIPHAYYFPSKGRKERQHSDPICLLLTLKRKETKTEY